MYWTHTQKNDGMCILKKESPSKKTNPEEQTENRQIQRMKIIPKKDTQKTKCNL